MFFVFSSVPPHSLLCHHMFACTTETYIITNMKVFHSWWHLEYNVYSLSLDSGPENTQNLWAVGKELAQIANESNKLSQKKLLEWPFQKLLQSNLVKGLTIQLISITFTISNTEQYLSYCSKYCSVLSLLYCLKLDVESI